MRDFTLLCVIASTTAATVNVDWTAIYNNGGPQTATAAALQGRFRILRSQPDGGGRLMRCVSQR